MGSRGFRLSMEKTGEHSTFVPSLKTSGLRLVSPMSSGSTRTLQPVAWSSFPLVRSWLRFLHQAAPSPPGQTARKVAGRASRLSRLLTNEGRRLHQDSTWRAYESLPRMVPPPPVSGSVRQRRAAPSTKSGVSRGRRGGSDSRCDSFPFPSRSIPALPRPAPGLFLCLRSQCL